MLQVELAGVEAVAAVSVALVQQLGELPARLRDVPARDGVRHVTQQAVLRPRLPPPQANLEHAPEGVLHAVVDAVPGVAETLTFIHT